MSENHYDFLDNGYTATLYRLPGTRKVCKSFLDGYKETHFPLEKEVYERLAAHGEPPTILKYYGVDEDDPAGIILELAEKGNLYKYRWDSTRVLNEPPSRDDFYRWARQAGEALAFMHSCSILHCDIHCVNFQLDENLDLKVADFAGASIEGRKPNSLYRLTHQLFIKGKDNKEISIASEIFALGSAMYQMVTDHDVFFPELNDSRDREEIRRRIRDKEFPDVSELPVLGVVIAKCWALEYESMEDVLQGIDAESRCGVGERIS
ncbi:hypothetical protein MMC12_000767 [Toensbergia leucococca]|nr:hypothetical protein [Toensbergia leucococca]